MKTEEFLLISVSLGRKRRFPSDEIFVGSRACKCSVEKTNERRGGGSGRHHGDEIRRNSNNAGLELNSGIESGQARENNEAATKVRAQIIIFTKAFVRAWKKITAKNQIRGKLENDKF